MQEFEEKKYSEWLLKNGFNKEEITYIVLGDSYSIKNELKAVGFIYSQTLRWHGPEPQGYDCIPVKVTDCFEKMAWGVPQEKPSAKEDIKRLIQQTRPVVNEEYEYYLEIKDRFYNLPVTLDKIATFDGYYGRTYVYNFIHGPYVFTWFTTKQLEYNINDTVSLTATIKDHGEYQGQKINYINRAIVK